MFECKFYSNKEWYFRPGLLVCSNSWRVCVAVFCVFFITFEEVESIESDVPNLRIHNAFSHSRMFYKSLACL